MARAATPADAPLSRRVLRTEYDIQRLLALNQMRRADSLASAWAAGLERRGDTLSQGYVEALGALSDARAAAHPTPSPVALRLALHAVELQERLSGPASPRLMYVLGRAATLSKFAGDQQAMRALLSRSSAIARLPGAPHDWFTVRGYFAAGSALIGAGQFSQADSMLSRGLDLADVVGVPDSILLARAIGWRSSTMRNLGNFAEAVPVCEHAMAIHERVLGMDAAEVGRCLNLLGGVLSAGGAHGGRPGGGGAFDPDSRVDA